MYYVKSLFLVTEGTYNYIFYLIHTFSNFFPFLNTVCIRGHGNFSVRGSGPKIFWGGCGGGSKCSKYYPWEKFFSVFFLIFKNHKWNLQVSVAGGYGQGCKINFQIGDLDRVSIKFFRRGIWMGNIGKYSEGGRALGGITNRQNMVRIGQKIVQMLIKSEI